jgi:hypothetical protein
MFNFAAGDLPVPQDLTGLFTETFEDVASPGNAWNGAERVAIAAVTRDATDPGAADLLPDAAVQAAARIAKHPSGSEESAVRDTVLNIGETRYVELVGISSAMTAIDSVTALLGFGVETLPEAHTGQPIAARQDPKLKRRSAWVAMDGPVAPRHALSAAPLVQDMVTRLIDRLYMSIEGLGGGSLVRGLTREQVEIVILKISHSNECYW